MKLIGTSEFGYPVFESKSGHLKVRMPKNIILYRSKFVKKRKVRAEAAEDTVETRLNDDFVQFILR